MTMDIIRDTRRLNDLDMQNHATSVLISGGGLVKHLAHNTNLMRNGANQSVLVSAASEFNGSDAGADADEAISSNKIRIDTNPAKVSAETALVFR